MSNNNRIKGELCAWKCATIASIIVGVFALAGFIIFHIFTVSNCEAQVPSVVQMVSVNNGEKIVLFHENIVKIESCSVKTPFSEIKPALNLSKRDQDSNELEFDDGRVIIAISGNRCEINIRKAMMKDKGQWEFFIGSGKYVFERTRHLCNVSVQNMPLAVTTAKNLYTQESVRISSTEKTIVPTNIEPMDAAFILTTFTKTLAQSTIYRNCPFGWNMFTSHCYKLFDNSVYIEREEASRFCQKESSYLSSIHSREEQRFIASYVRVQYPKKKVWIGGTLQTKRWKWDDGQWFGYTNWHINEPNSEVRCMYLNHLNNYSWHDASCGTEGKRWAISIFLCKKPV